MTEPEVPAPQPPPDPSHARPRSTRRCWLVAGTATLILVIVGLVAWRHQAEQTPPGLTLETLSVELQCQPQTVYNSTAGYIQYACPDEQTGSTTVTNNYLYTFTSAGAQTIWLQREVGGGNTWYLVAGPGWAYRTYNTNLATNAVNIGGSLLSGG